MKDSLSIVTNLLKSQKTLDSKIFSFFKQRHEGDILILDQGRSAMQAAIEDFSLQGSEIIVPSFICSDVFTNLFIQNKITPKIVDCRPGSLHIHPDDVKKAISSKTKAVIIVHTYGIPNDPKPFRKLCNSKNLILIEDCAHAIDVNFKGKYLGSYGDAAIFSFVKEMPNYLGGAYVKNKGQISNYIKENLSRRKISMEDILVLSNKFSISKLLKRVKSSISNTAISNLYFRVNISLMSKLSKAIFCSKMNSLKIEQKRAIAIKLNKILPKGVSMITDQQIKSSSAKCFPFIVKNKSNIIKNLEQAGFNPGRGWIPSFSTNLLAKKHWNIPKSKVAESYEKDLINIDLDEITDYNLHKIIKIVS